jgi:hypothetical protein
VLDRGCINHMTRKRRMFTFFEKNKCESDCITFGNKCLFTDKGVTVFRRSDGSFAFKCVLRSKLYLMSFIPEEVELDRCLITKTNMGLLWH